MAAECFSMQLEQTMRVSQANLVTENADFFARLLYENLPANASREHLARYYISQKLYIQTTKLLANPTKNIEFYLLGVAHYHLQEYDQAIKALMAGATRPALADFFRRSDVSEFESVFLDQPSPKTLNQNNKRFSCPKSPESVKKDKVSSKQENITSAMISKSYSPQKTPVNIKSGKSPELTQKSRQGTPKTRKLQNQRKDKKQTVDFKILNFDADCVANGAFGFYFLGLCFERQRKLEKAAMCFRNSYRLNNLLFSSYIRFVEVTAQIQYESKVIPASRQCESNVETRAHRDALKRKTKFKFIDSSKIINFLLQDTLTTPGLLRKRSEMDESVKPRSKSPKAAKEKKPSCKRRKPESDPRKEEPVMAAGNGLSDMNRSCFRMRIEGLKSRVTATSDCVLPAPKVNISRFETFSFSNGVNTLKISPIPRLSPQTALPERPGMTLKTSSLICPIAVSEEPIKSPFSDIFTHNFADKSILNTQKENSECPHENDPKQHSPRHETECDRTAGQCPKSNSIKKLKPSTNFPGNKQLAQFLSKLKLGVIHFAFNEFPETITAFKTVTEDTDQRCTYAIVQTARSLMNRMGYTEAAALFEQAISLNPNTVDGLDYYSSCLWYNRSASAMVDLEVRVSKDFANHPICHVVQGNFCSLVKKNPQAIESFKKYLKLDPNNSYIHCLLGHEYMFTEDFANATACYTRSIEEDWRQYNAYWGLGNIAKLQDNPKAALIHFYNALGINPHCRLLHTYIGLSNLSLGLSQLAVKNFTQAEAQGEDPMSSYYKALALFKMNDLKSAKEVLEKLISEVKTEPKLYLLLGKTHVKMGEKDKAHECFIRAISLDPRDSQGKIRELSDLVSGNISLD